MADVKANVAAGTGNCFINAATWVIYLIDHVNAKYYSNGLGYDKLAPKFGDILHCVRLSHFYRGCLPFSDTKPLIFFVTNVSQNKQNCKG